MITLHAHQSYALLCDFRSKKLFFLQNRFFTFMLNFCAASGTKSIVKNDLTSNLTSFKRFLDDHRWNHNTPFRNEHNMNKVTNAGP